MKKFIRKLTSKLQIENLFYIVKNAAQWLSPTLALL